MQLPGEDWHTHCPNPAIIGENRLDVVKVANSTR